MRTLFSSILLFITWNAAFAACPSEETLKRIADFRVVSSHPNKQLSKEEARFSFTITNSGLEHLVENGEPVLASFNNERFDFSLKNGTTHNLTVKPGKYVFQFYIYEYEEIYSDSVLILPGYETKVNLYFHLADYPALEEKPVIYVYPKEDTPMNIQVNPKGSMTFTYPEIGNGWNVVAHPDGSMSIAGKTYPYLFWEATDHFSASDIDLKQGFIVTGKEAIPFLEEHLATMGLNSREQTDFITYWGPRLAANEQQFVHFVVNKACDRMATLDITPAPEAVYRIFMVWSPMPEGMHLQPQAQVLPAMDRSGFHVVEWGGAELDLFRLSSMLGKP